MFGALIRAAEPWRGLPFTEFETRQIAAVRKDLDDESQTSVTPLARSFPAPCFHQIRALTSKVRQARKTSCQKNTNLALSL
jgi:hypothetical protein